MRDDLKKNMKKDFDEATERMRNVDFQVDTLSVGTSTGGYFSSGSNSITVNYVEGDKKFNEWSGSNALLVHEQKHRDNENQGVYAYAISKEQAYKLNMHDEISANIASLIYLRDKYLKTGDISVFEEEGGRFSFYANAIENGEINPFNNSKEDFDKEMSLIANGTRNMWVHTFSDSYVEQNCSFAESYGERNGKNAEFYDQNYERAKKIAYNIGGVDFTEYMDKEVEIPDAAKMRVVPAEQLISQMNLPKYDGKMSLLQYQKLLQHALLMKDKNVGINSKDFFPGGVESYGRFNLDMGAYCYLTDGKLSDITHEKYRDALNNLSDKEALNCINGIIINIAKDYEERGELLPKGDDKAYNDAVDKLYTGKVKFNQDDLKYEGEINLRKAFNPNDELPLNELPNVAKKCQQKLEDMGGWERGLKQYASFFGGDVNLEKMSNLPAVVRYPVEALGVYVGTPIVEGGKKIIEYGKAGVDSVKEWFGEKKENIPVRPPVMCPGCPHRGIFYTLKSLNYTVLGDIGCYTLGGAAPLTALDTTICMGASVSMLHGFNKVRPENSNKTVAVIGDSTFMHSGITGLIDIAYNRSISTVLVLDNHITGMTGHQQNPCTGLTLKNVPVDPVDIEKVCLAAGIKRVRTIDPNNLKECKLALQEETAALEPSVIIVRRPCALLKKVVKKPSLSIDTEKCKKCKACMKIGCPAISFDGEKVAIDKTLCVGCDLCKGLCAFDAIK
jgi:pyruvate/2-oxoacid:ferredoxin oxidoreductase beta subunit